MASLAKSAKAWRMEIEKANQKLSENLGSSRRSTAMAGFAGRAGDLQAVVDTTAPLGTVGQQGLYGAFDAFMGAAPGADFGQATTAVRASQRAGTAGLDVGLFASVAGIIIQHHPGMSVGEAADAAAFIISNMGNDAKQAVEVLPRLFRAGLSIEDAMGVYQSLRGQGRQGRSQALSALSTGLRPGAGLSGASAILQQQGMGAVGAPVNTAGFLDDMYARQLSDPRQRLDVAVQANLNAAQVDSQARADQEFALRQAEFARDDATRIGADSYLFQTVRGIQAAAPGIAGEGADRSVTNQILGNLPAIRSLRNDED
jgi:hypothetical protein